MNGCDCIKKLYSCPVAVSLGIILISGISLAGAYTAQYGFGLEPCILCLYQRVPYAVAILLGLTGLVMRKKKSVISAFVFLSALIFLIGGVIASYHVGVEQKWWVSAVEGCKVPLEGTDSQSLLDQIMSATTARCDEVAWRDPFFGGSMALYNALLSFFLAINCAIAASAIRQRPSG